MPIINITTDDLRKMSDKEGLILQGCGGDLQEWIDGVNEMLTKDSILLNGTKFDTVYCFENGNHTNLLYPFENVEVNIGKLAMWRLSSYQEFCGTWLSDYVPNYLGGFIEERASQKPDCELIGQDGNIFNLMGIASRTLRENGMEDKAEEMVDKIHSSAESYYDALNIIGEYVNITGPDEDIDEGFEQSM
jgi:hypothetical protein